MLVAGELRLPREDDRILSVNPATEEPIGVAPAARPEDVREAVLAAADAQKSWAACDIDVRAGLLNRLADALDDRSEEIAVLEASDTGSTIGKMKDDVKKSARQIRYFAGLAYELKGETIPASADGLHLTVREPFGVVGRIVPFNHPIMFAATRLAAPLLAGNSVIVKPPEQAPLTSGILSEICHEVAPPGLISILPGWGHVVGDAIVRDPLIRRLSLTGSAPTGMRIQHSAAETSIKNVTLELGGKNPCIIFPDADLDAAIAGAVSGMNFAWGGQSCGSTSRLLVHSSQYDEVVERVTERVASIRVGDPLDPEVGMGPLISAQHRDRVLGFIDTGVQEGARLTTGGGRPQGERFTKGFWVEPTVFADVVPGMKIFDEEIFGPVLSITPWSEEDEMIRLANATDYGLTASIWTQDLARAVRTARAVQTGYVWINHVSKHHRGVPFGGVKNSGIGREEHLEELLSYTECKAINIQF